MDEHLEIKFQNNVSYLEIFPADKMQPSALLHVQLFTFNLMKVVYNNKTSFNVENYTIWPTYYTITSYCHISCKKNQRKCKEVTYYFVACHASPCLMLVNVDSLESLISGNLQDRLANDFIFF